MDRFYEVPFQEGCLLVTSVSLVLVGFPSQAGQFPKLLAADGLLALSLCKGNTVGPILQEIQLVTLEGFFHTSHGYIMVQYPPNKLYILRL